MKKFLAVWFALSLALNPVAGAVASSMQMPANNKAQSHCHGHATQAKPAQDLPRDCCRPGHVPKQCCDHCAGLATIPALMNTVLAVFLTHASDLIIGPAGAAPSVTDPPPYRPPQV
jgi:hypothetical protein